MQQSKHHQRAEVHTYYCPSGPFDCKLPSELCLPDSIDTCLSWLSNFELSRFSDGLLDDLIGLSLRCILLGSEGSLVTCKALLGFRIIILEGWCLTKVHNVVGSFVRLGLELYQYNQF
jgi:hypothetical protein